MNRLFFTRALLPRFEFKLPTFNVEVQHIG